MRDKEPEKVSPRSALGAVGALTLAALAWRLVGLDAEGLWNDELFTALLARSDWPSALDLIRHDVHPPLYFAMIWLWTGIAGDSETALRLPSAIFGALVVPSLFALGKRMLGWQSGLLAALFAAVLYTPWYQSQEARPYSLALLLSAWVGYFAYGVLEKLREARPPTRADLCGFVASGAALAATHYFGLLLVGLMGAFLGVSAIVRPAGRAAVFLALGALVAFYAPWIPVTLSQMRKETYIQAPTWETLDQVAGVLFNAFSGIQVLVVALAVAAFVRYKRLRPPSKGLAPEALLALWIVVPLGMAIVKSAVSAPVLTPKSMIVAVPAALLLLGRMCELLGGRYSARIALAATLALVSLGADLYFSGQFRRPIRAQFREAAAYVARRWDGLATLKAFAWDARNFDYYLTPASDRMAARKGGDARSRVIRLDPDQAGTEGLGALWNETEGFWLLQGDFPIPEGIYAAIERACDRLDRAEFHQVVVTLYRPKKPRSPRPEEGL